MRKESNLPAEVPRGGRGGELPTEEAGFRVPCCGPPLAPLPPPQMPRDVEAAPGGGSLHNDLALLFYFDPLSLLTLERNV